MVLIAISSSRSIGAAPATHCRVCREEFESAARALARMDQVSLSAASGLSEPRIKRLEKMVGPITATARTEAAIRKAFSEVGVVFIDPDAEGPGVRLAMPPA